jgi:pimeloyl-ACP methyl ester carboxylesterase
MSKNQQVVNKRVLNTHVSGEGSLLVMGHCLMGSMAVDDEVQLFDWQKIAKHCTLLRYDAIGHGDSEGSPEAEDYLWTNLADGMLKLADNQNKGKAILGGVSMGCATALQAAVNNPGAVKALILVLPPTAWRTRAKQAKFYRRFASIASLFGTVPFKLLDKLLQRFGGKNQNNKQGNKQSEMAITVLKHLKNAEIAFLTATLKGAAMSDLPDMETLKSLKIPTAIFAWADDSSHPESTAILLKQLLPQVEHFEIAQSDDTDHWTESLISFIQTHAT